MATAEVTVEWSQPLRDLKEVMPRAAEILTDVEDLAETTIFPFFRSHVQRAYATQGRATGSPWADYSAEPKYAAYKAGVIDRFDEPSNLPVDKNQPGGLLRWAPASKERLYPSLTDESHTDHIRRVRDMSMEYGTAVPYAERLFETGGTGPFGEDYPPRPVLQLGSAAKREYQAAIDQHFRNRLEDELGIDLS